MPSPSATASPTTGESTPTSTTTVVTTPAPSGDSFADVAAACANTTYARCLEGIQLMIEQAPGSLVAVCEYGDATGDIVLLERREDAEAECSADGLISPSRVVAVLQLP
jgi:hypothetical protein